MGIPVGAKLFFANDQSISAIVCGDRRIMFQEVECSLTHATKQILGITHHVPPTPYWIYDNRNLQDIYNETYVMDE